MSIEITIIILGVLSLLVSVLFLRLIIKKDPLKGVPQVQADRMAQITEAISSGAQAFLRREFSQMLIFIIGFSLLIFLIIDFGSALSFVVGAFCSIGAGWLGMKAATLGNIRTVSAARRSLRLAFRVAFQSGAVMGFGLVGIALLGLILMYLIYQPFIKDTRHLMESLAGFGLGASSIALFARVGGGIFTKAADMGADLVGKIEQNIPEDDPRNPAVIADNVGDNVGDVAGMGSDLFGSIAESTCAALVIGAAIFSTQAALLYPISLTAFGVPVALVVSFFVRASTPRKAASALKFSLLASTALMIVVTFFVTTASLPEEFLLRGKEVTRLGVYLSVLSGLISGLLIGIITEFYTSSHQRPVRELVNATRTGAATNIVMGMALGHRSSVIPMILLGITVYIGFSLAGMYGIALSAIGMLGVVIMTLTIDAFGPVADNAGGIAQMAQMDDIVRRRTDVLDAAGNTTAAVGKGFAIGSAALTSLALIAAFLVRSGIDSLDLLKPSVISLLLIGAVLPFSFTSMTLRAVGRTAKELINECRRQFAANPALRNTPTEDSKDAPSETTSLVLPNYRRCVDIATQAALRNMILPAIQVLFVPILVGFVLGVEALAGLLIGSLASGAVLAISSVNAGGAWDNAKKLIEQGQLGGKGSDSHAAAVIGDTVGDPLKDTSGPSLNILIKLQAIVSLVFAPSFGQGWLQLLFG